MGWRWQYCPNKRIPNPPRCPERKNQRKKERNDALYAEVLDLRKGQEAIEERARDELGMIKENETFFQVIEEK